MNTKHLFDALQANKDDPRPIVLEMRTRDGLFKKVLTGVAADSDAIYLCAGDANDLPDKGSSSDRAKVTPLPTSPRVGPDGEFYPVG